MPRKFSPTTLGILLAGTAAPLVAYSQVYFTEDQAVKVMFPGETWVRKSVDLTPDEIRQIEDRSGEKVRNTSVVAWVSRSKNMVFMDQVLGKHEFITYAVGVTNSKKVSSIEILEYRETYGQQVRGAEWRKRFVGKDSGAPLRLKQDIVNISGATLSSAHVTAGVRRVLQTYELVRARL